MKTSRKTKTLHGLLVLCALALASAGCGEGSQRASGPRAEPESEGEPRFEIVSSWEPSLQRAGQETDIEYSLTVANRGSSSGEVTCEIWMNGERLPGESTTVTIDPGAEGTVEGDVRAQPDDIDLTDLTPRCE
ncbi:MAG TPA: hypothetical protein VHI71_03315 [Actinomycetota bacterium]|nr:hypothetical protein [Actinomycetota bacterium]